MCKHRKLAALVWPGVPQLASPQQLRPTQQRGEGARLQHREPPAVYLEMRPDEAVLLNMSTLSHLDILVQIGQVVTQGEDNSQQHLPGIRQFGHRTIIQ